MVTERIHLKGENGICTGIEDDELMMMFYGYGVMSWFHGKESHHVKCKKLRSNILHFNKY